jgi:hypothetical protein
MCGRADPGEMLAIMGTPGYWRREDNAYGQLNPARSSAPVIFLLFPSSVFFLFFFSFKSLSEMRSVLFRCQ